MARNLNEYNLAGIENPHLYNYVAEFIPLASSDYMLEFIRVQGSLGFVSSNANSHAQWKHASLLIGTFLSMIKH